MTLTGYVRNGQIVVDVAEQLPEGAAVRIEVLASTNRVNPPGESLGQRLLRHAGKARGLPRDASRNHGHYLYGTPKR